MLSPIHTKDNVQHEQEQVDFDSGSVKYDHQGGWKKD
jgi:hypothetical protein